MTQESQIGQSTAAAGAGPPKKGRLPGLLPAAGVAILAGIGCWMWLSSESLTAGAARGATVMSELAEVSEQEIPVALATLNGSPNFLTQFTDRKTSCPQPLAWVSLAGTPQQAGLKVRLKSGMYFSPIFTLSASPVRVAIPFPAPYEAGRGPLAALIAGGSAVVALQPAWHTAAQGGESVRIVTWRVAKRCKTPNG